MRRQQRANIPQGPALLAAASQLPPDQCCTRDYFSAWGCQARLGCDVPPTTLPALQGKVREELLASPTQTPFLLGRPAGWGRSKMPEDKAPSGLKSLTSLHFGCR